MLISGHIIKKNMYVYFFSLNRICLMGCITVSVCLYVYSSAGLCMCETETVCLCRVRVGYLFDHNLYVSCLLTGQSC